MAAGPPFELPGVPCVESETLELTTLLVEDASERHRTVRGVDLDGHQTDSSISNAAGCGHLDQEDPDGTLVDSQFTFFLPTIEVTT